MPPLEALSCSYMFVIPPLFGPMSLIPPREMSGSAERPPFGSLNLYGPMYFLFPISAVIKFMISFIFFDSGSSGGGPFAFILLSFIFYLTSAARTVL